MLATKNLSYAIAGKQILKNISFEIEEGQFVGLLGPNGSGKTTLIRILSGIYRNYDGTASLKLLHLNRLPPRGLAQSIAVVPQEADFAFPFSALEIVLMGRSPFQKHFAFNSVADHQIARAAMEKTDCWQFAARPMDTLSGGEKQRVLLARALAQKPRILLLDEPASHLDFKHQRTLFSLLKNLNCEQKITIVCVVHDLNIASLYFDQLLLLKEGLLSIFGKTDEVLNRENIKKIFDIDFSEINHEGRRFFYPQLSSP